MPPAWLARHPVTVRLALTALLILVGIGAAASYADAALVAVGYNGAVLTSPDGTTWLLQIPPSGHSFLGMTQGDQVVAVATDGAAYRSTTAATWASMLPATPQWLFGTATDGSTYVAVGTGGVILTSFDGTTWVEQTSPTGLDLYAIASDGTEWVAVGAGGTVVRSNNAITWTMAPSSGATLRGLAHANGLWVGVGNGVIKTTSDMTTWTTRDTAPPDWTFPARDFHGVAFDGTQWIAVGTFGTIRSSPDGLTWTEQDSGGPHLYGVTPPCGGGWTAVGTGGTILTSLTGATWTPVGIGVTPENLSAVTCVLSCSPLTTSIQTGASATFNAVGGSGNYAWTAAGATTPTGDGLSFTASFMVAGTYNVVLRDTNGAQNRTCTVQVIDPPPTTCAPGHSNLAPGNQVTFVTSGGVAPYTWTAPGTTSPGPVIQPTFTLTFPDEGDFTINVRDSGPPVTDADCTVSVRRLACLPTIREVLVGHEATLQALGGVAPYTWSLPAGRPDQSTDASVIVTYDEVGTYTAALTDSDDPPKTVECSVQVAWPPARQDADVDGVPDEADNCPANTNRDQADDDSDGEGDACDDEPRTPSAVLSDGGFGVSRTLDGDRDGTVDALDNCHAAPNFGQADQDRDGWGDVCDADRDGDGVLDRGASQLNLDNCPTTPNRDQRDWDVNGVGDACEGIRSGASPDAFSSGDDLQRRSGLGWAEAAAVLLPLAAAGIIALVLWGQRARRRKRDQVGRRGKI